MTPFTVLHTIDYTILITTTHLFVVVDDGVTTYNQLCCFL